MARITDPNYADEHPLRYGASVIGVGWLAVVLVLALSGLIVLALWAGGVLFAPVKGRADAYKQQQSGTNRIFAQQHFETLFGDIRSSDAKLDQAFADKTQNPTNTFFATTYTGLVNVCLDQVNTYNQDAHKYLDKDFLSADLPLQVGNTPDTDCKPSGG